MTKNVSISFAITASTEHLELKRLLTLLTQNIRDIDEVVLQVDSTTVTQEVRNVISEYPSVKFIEFPLNNHFGNFKNNLKSYCTGDYIFQIDADELPEKTLIQSLPTVIEQNPTVGLFHIPRVNIVDGITEHHIEKWNWSKNPNGWINWPDWQPRFFKNSPEIEWLLPVHETINNYGVAAFFPALKEYSLFHPKSIHKQETQNEFYSTL